VQLLKTKDEAIVAYKAFMAWVWMQHGATICHLQSDCGGEYTGKVFTKFLQEQGTEQQLTTHNMPEHNGVVELLNHCLLEHMCAMLHQSSLPKMLWGEALNHTIWLKNHSLMQVIGNTMPYKQVYKCKPNLASIPKWGQQVWVHNHKGNKLEAHRLQANWVGHDSNSLHTHRIYWLERCSISVE
jgi:hypothetical protein